MSSRPSSATGDSLLAIFCWLAALTIVFFFVWLTLDIFRQGLGQLSWTFFWSQPQDAGRSGGISTILISTALVLFVCLTVSLPLGIASAAWLAEFTTPGSRLAQLVRRSLDLLASMPSIIFGLFGLVFFCQLLNMGFSILSGGLTLAAMILPIVVQATYIGFRSVPDELRRGAAALGLRRITTLRHLLLPAAVHGVTIGVILGIGRALAETAALIFTSGYVTRMPRSLFDSGRTLSVHIYDLAMNVPGASERAHATSLVLLGSLLVINICAQRLTQLWLKTKT